MLIAFDTNQVRMDHDWFGVGLGNIGILRGTISYFSVYADSIKIDIESVFEYLRHFFSRAWIIDGMSV